MSGSLSDISRARQIAALRRTPHGRRSARGSRWLHSSHRRGPALAHRLACGVLGVILSVAATPPAATAQDPGVGEWLQYADQAASGFDTDALESARAFADSVGAGAVMAVYRGRVVAAWGAVAREFEAHSVRKSLVSALYGAAVAEGRIDLEATVGDLGIDDIHALTESEKSARLRDLLAARSGIYLPAAYAPSGQDEERPERGAHAPGTHWFYNNWDFNVAGIAYERLTGEDLYEAFARRLARPLGMEDWEPSDGFRVYEPTRSRHPAHTFRISTRDLARVGQLYLQHGRWSGEQVVPARWVAESTRSRSEAIDASGYGYMWWTYAAGSLPADAYPVLRRHDLYMGRGTGGQGVWVIPALDLVVVVRGDTDHGDGVRGFHAWAIAERIAAALPSTPADDPELVPLAPVALASQLPAPPPPPTEHPDPRLLERLWGQYELAPGAVARVFEWEDRPFIHVPGEGDAELFLAPDGGITIRVLAGVRIFVEEAADGTVQGLVLTLGPERMEARRLP